MALHQIGVPAKSFSASQISMKTTNTYSKARILDVDGKKIQETLDAGLFLLLLDSKESQNPVMLPH